MAHDRDDSIDRRDDLRRRIYLACLVFGIPVLSSVWFAHRGTDPFMAVAYPPYALSQVWVLVQLWRRRMGVRTAERVILVGTVITFIGGLGIGVLTAEDLAQLRDQMTVSSMLTINLMAMIAYVAFETRVALRFSLAIVGSFVVMVAVRLVPDVAANGFGTDVPDYLSLTMFLLTSVGLLHVMAQVKEQAAEANLTAAAMEALANTDALTGLANRRQLHENLEAQVGACEDCSLTVFLLDIDHFKRVNDTHGHATGDSVLKQVADILTRVVGSAGLVGRWGGEEFVVIVAGLPVDAAMAIAEDCRAAVADTAFVPVGRVTASIGAAGHRPDDTAWTLLSRADEALYEAKARGRNKVVSHIPTRRFSDGHVRTNQDRVAQ